MRYLSNGGVFRLFFSYLFIGALGWAPSLGAVEIGLNSIAEGGNSASFRGLLLEGSGNPNVGVVLMHGRESNSDGPVVRQLRQALNSAGYTTLSIDNPQAGVDANFNANFRDFIDYEADVQSTNQYAFPEAYARVRTAVNYLQSLGIEEVVVLGFSMGSRFTAAHIAHGQVNELPIVGFIGIGMYGNSVSVLNHTITLPNVSVPVLDLYGDEDTDAKTTAFERMGAYGGDDLDYQVVVLDCAAGLTQDQCHQLTGLKSNDGESCQALENNVLSWITTEAPLADPQGLGVCDSNSGRGMIVDEGGGSNGIWFTLLLAGFGVRRVVGYCASRVYGRAGGCLINRRVFTTLWIS